MRLVGNFNCINESVVGYDNGDLLIMPELPETGVEHTGFPGEVEMILSAMEAARSGAIDRRASSRNSYRTVAELKLFSDDPFNDPIKLYTRDLHERGIGFITRERLPLGYGGMVKITLPNGQKTELHCTIFRCRETVSGWFEGALYFSRSQNCWR